MSTRVQVPKHIGHQRNHELEREHERGVKVVAIVAFPVSVADLLTHRALAPLSYPNEDPVDAAMIKGSYNVDMNSFNQSINQFQDRTGDLMPSCSSDS